ncbi:MAG: cytidylate kinase-like family protein [Proteobacteria bacterium]|nr:cytidylate kinase-like family protein [Pseudomonadota bacterium]
MTKGILIPSVDHRLSSWIEINRRSRTEKEQKNRISITISRDFGCDGYPVAAELRNLLDNETQEWTIFDHALIDKVAEKSEFSERLIKEAGLASGYMDAVVATFQKNWKKEIDVFKALARNIIGAAKAGNAIIVGRGSGYLTQGMKDCFQFNIVGSREFRLNNIMKKHKMESDEALAFMTENESIRQTFNKRFLKDASNEPHFFHLVLNNEHANAEMIARVIVQYIELNRTQER